MTAEDIIKELFEGHQIRLYKIDGREVIPLVDLAEAWGMSRHTMYMMIKRNNALFEGTTVSVHKSAREFNDENSISVHNELCTQSGISTRNTLTGENSIICISVEGLYLLIAKISTSKLKSRSVKDAILRFRKEAPNILKKEATVPLIERQMPEPAIPVIEVPAYAQSKVVPRIDPNLWDLDGLRKGLSAIETLQKKTGCNPKELQVQLLNAMGMEFMGTYLAGCNLPQIEKPSIVYGIKGALDATDIGKRIDYSPQSVNKVLEKLGYQFKDETTNLWRITEKAKNEDLGQEYYPEQKSGHKEWRIRWFPKVMAVLAENGIVEPQKELEQKQIEAAKQETPINLSQKPDFVQPAYPPRKIADL